MKRILITGANRGIGLEFVRQYSARGERIFATCRHPERAKALHELASRSPETITLLALDVASEASIKEATATVTSLTDTLDLLIHNAGIANTVRENVSSRWGQWEMTEILAVLQTNAVGAMILTQHLYLLLKNSEGGIVAGISSGMGSLTQVRASETLNFAYAGSKTLMNSFLHHLAPLLEKDKIKTVAFDPGWVRTDMGGDNATLSPEESVTGLIQVLDNLTPEQSGQYLSYSGNVVAW